MNIWFQNNRRRFDNPEFHIAMDAAEAAWDQAVYQLDSEGELQMADDRDKLIREKANQVKKAYLDQLGKSGDDEKMFADLIMRLAFSNLSIIRNNAETP